jgi:segregation and condensation protein A
LSDAPETPLPPSSGFKIQLPAFEGPLDLLLHLIQEHKLDIFDIPVSFITDRYIEYLDRMRELDLDVAGEFLQMAATLAHIKSRMLLPREERPPEEGGEEGQDPREELVRRLLQLQKYRDAAQKIGERPQLQRDVFVRPKTEAPPAKTEDVPLAEVSVFKLIDLFDRALKKARVHVPHQVLVERVSVAQRITELLDLFAAASSERMKFEELLDESATKGKIVVTFLALLEMARLKLVRVHQIEGDGSVWVTRAKEAQPEGEVNDLGYR